MSAIAAFWSFQQPKQARDSVDRMLAAQEMYGRDAKNAVTIESVAMGRCLKRTLPEDMYDRQPIVSGSEVMVADVRLDDRAGLAGLMGIDASDAVDLTDAVLLLRAWQHWGETMFDYVYGDYAFALWRQEHHSLVLARDALGGRPLHYHLGESFVAAASMPKGLLALPHVPRALNLDRIAEFVGLFPERVGATVYSGIRKVRAGEIVSIAADGSVTQRMHWTPPTSRDRFSPNQNYSAEMLNHLDRAVKTRLRGAGNVVACELSSGLDSSAVATSAALQIQLGQRLLALTAAPREGYDEVGPEGRDGHEDRWAAQTAARYPAIDHVVVRTASDEGGLGDLDLHAFLCDVPMVNPCNMAWVYRVYGEAERRGASVLLTGVKGNATFSFDGTGMLQELAQEGAWLRFVAAARAEAKGSGGRLSGAILRGLAHRLPKPIWRVLVQMMRNPPLDRRDRTALREEWYRRCEAGSFGAKPNADPLRPYSRSARETQLLMLLWDEEAVYNKGCIAGWGLDVRDPTSDRRLVEYCLRLPLEAWRPGGKRRGLALEALRKRVPTSVLINPRRGLQAIDWHEAMTESRQQIRDEFERLAEVPEVAAVLDLPRLQVLLDDWPTTGWHSAEVSRLYRHLLAQAIAAGRFMRISSSASTATPEKA